MAELPTFREFIVAKKIALVTCYAPNSYQPPFFESLSKIISEMSDYDVIIGGDMNAVIDPQLDRSKNTLSNISANLALTNLIKNYALVDIWRMKNPTSKEFTFFSARHYTSLRIDYILTSSKIVHLVHC